MTLTISSEAMTSGADMTLDDIIKKKKAAAKKTGGKKPAGQNARGNQKKGGNNQRPNRPNVLRGTRGGGVNKQSRNRGNRPAQIRPQMSNFGMSQGSGKLDIANLHFSVTDADIRELFSEFGQIKSSAIHYGSNGHSLGTAHVHFAQPRSATQALNRYNGVHLDGRPMRISTKDGGPQQMQRGGAGPMRGGNRRMGGRINQGNRQQNQGGNRNQQNRGGNKNQQNRGGNRNQQNKGGNRGGAGRRGGKQTKQETPTVDQLNEQLDAYLSQAAK